MIAIGVVETLSIPMGVLAGDQMLKTAQVELIEAQTTCPGKYIVVICGEVAAVLDLDSPLFSRFSPGDQQGLEAFVRVLETEWGNMT